MEFQFYAPTKVVFGKDSHKQVGTLLKEYNAKKVLVHYGQNSVVKSGLLDEVLNCIKAQGIEYICLGGVQPNPRLSLVEKGIELVKANDIDFLLAVGGGSVIDSCKAIGYGVLNEGDLRDYYLKKKSVKACMPVGCILTIAAAGSEMSESSVISNEETKQKRGLSSDTSRLKFSILNPELTYTLPPYQSMSGCVDIMMHTFERYFTHKPNDLQSMFALTLLKNIVKHAPIILKDPTNYESRAQIMWSSTMSHNDVTGSRVHGDWACHQLEHELSAMFDVAHGAGLAAIWTSWAYYVYEENIARFALYAKEVFDICEEDEKLCAIKGIEATKAFFKAIDMPVCISDMNVEVNDEIIKELAYRCTYEQTRTIGKFKVLDIHDIEQIYKNAR